MTPFRPLTRLAIAGGVADTAVLQLGDGHPLIQAIAAGLPPIGAVLAVAAAARRAGRPALALTGPLCIGAALVALGSLAGRSLPLASGKVLDHPGPADVLMFLGYGCYALFLLRWTGRFDSLDRRGRLDAVILTLSLSPVVWRLLLPAGATASLDAGKVTLLLYPTFALGLATLALRLYFVAGTRTRMHALTFGWIGMELVGDLGLAHREVRGAVSAWDSTSHTAWVLSSVCLAVLAVHSRDQLAAPLVARPPRVRFRLPLLGLAAFVPVLLLYRDQHDPVSQQVELGVTAVVIALVMFRLSSLTVDLNEERAEHALVVELSRELQVQAFRDAVTGLGNRSKALRALDEALAGAPGSGQRVGLLLLDLDDFKTVNDTLGHAAGDRLLRAVAERLRVLCGPGVTLARLGGDEFVIVLPATRLTELITLAGRVVAALAGNEDVENGIPPTSASVGVTLADRRQNGDTLLAEASTAVYAVKRTGGNGHQVYSRHAHRALVDRQQLDHDLREALPRGELRMEYQPIIDLRTGAISGAEALMRWDHPTRGPIPPMDFIPLAEASGTITRLGAWSLDAAAAEMAGWIAEFGPQRLSHIAVNLSRRQFDIDLIGLVDATLQRHGVAPERVLLEVTETSLADSGPDTVELLEQLRHLGCRIAIDDFGTGYSALSELRALPLDVIKIDRSFVAGIARTREEWALTTAIAKLAASLDKDTLAEGIETGAQLAHLRSLGCQLGQGYLFSRPLRPERLTELLRERRTLLPSGSATVRGSSLFEPDPH